MIEYFGLRRTVAPAAVVLEPQDVVNWGELQVGADQGHSPAWLAATIAAVTEQLEEEIDQALITQTWEMTLDAFPCWEIRLPKGPNWSFTGGGIAYLDSSGVSQSVAASDYRLDAVRGRLTPAYGKTWPCTYDVTNAVTITFTCGHGDTAVSVPERAKTIIKMCALDWYLNRKGPLYDLPAAVKRLVRALWSGRIA